jgi:hypothetical protein
MPNTVSDIMQWVTFSVSSGDVLPEIVGNASWDIAVRPSSGGINLDDFYADSRSTTKPQILSIVKSVSDEVSSTSSRILSAISSATNSIQIPSVGMGAIDSDITIDNQGTWIALTRGLSLSPTQPEMVAYLMANNVVFATWTAATEAESPIDYSSFSLPETIGDETVYVHQLAYTFTSSATGIYDWFGFVYDGNGGYNKFGKSISLNSPLTPDLSNLVTTAQAEIYMASMVQQSVAAQVGFSTAVIRDVTMYLANGTIERATTALSSADSIYCPSGAFVAQDFYMRDVRGIEYRGGTIFDYVGDNRMKPIDLPVGTVAADWMTAKGWGYYYVP